MNYTIISSDWELPYTTLYFAPSIVKFLYIRTIQIPQLTAVHMHTESGMYFV